MKQILFILSLLLLQGCATSSAIHKLVTGDQFDDPINESSSTYLLKEENKLNPPSGGPLPVAVYGFTDKTGQRKSIPNVASFSSAVTQGAENYLIKALQDVGDARWFKVVERVGLENLIKERQMIRQMRDQYQGKDAPQLPPMIFAGIIFEGATDIGVKSSDLVFPARTPINNPTDRDFKEFATAFKNLSGSKEKVETLITLAKAGHRKDKT